MHDLSRESSNSFKVAVLYLKVFRRKIIFVFGHRLSSRQNITFNFIELSFNCGCNRLLPGTSSNENNIENKKDDQFHMIGHNLITRMMYSLQQGKSPCFRNYTKLILFQIFHLLSS